MPSNRADVVLGENQLSSVRKGGAPSPATKVPSSAEAPDWYSYTYTPTRYSGEARRVGGSSVHGASGLSASHVCAPGKLSLS